MIETKKLIIIQDPEKGFVLAHTFIPDDDHRRYTDYYICGNLRAAETLMRCIRKPPKPDPAETQKQITS